MRVTRAVVIGVLGALVACADHVPTGPDAATRTTTSAAGGAVDNAQWPNQPAGLSVIAERGFASKARTLQDVSGAEGWDPNESRYRDLAVVRERSAPKSAPTVMQVTYARGARGGISPGKVRTAISGSTRALYVSLWVKLSSTWTGESDLLRLSIAGQPRIAVGIARSAAGTYVPSASLSATPDNRRRLDATTTSVTIDRNVWRRLEVVAKSNGSTADGTLQIWVDGQKTFDYSNLQLVRAGESNTWQSVELDPTWGTTSDRVSQTMHMWWDHVYVSGESVEATPVPLATPLAPAADNAVFSEDFESGTLGAWQDGVNATKHHVLTDAALAHSGTHVLEMTYPAGQGGGWLTRFFMPGYDSLYVSYWVRTEPAWSGATSLLGLRGSRMDNQWSAFGKAGACPSGSDFFAATITTGLVGDPLDLAFDTYAPGMVRSSNGVNCWGREQPASTATYGADRRLTPGAWHKVELWVKLNTVGQNDAVERMWIDGQLAGERTGFMLRTDNILRLNSLMLDGAAVAPQTQRLYIDDVEVLATGPAVTPPPPAPVASVSVTLNSPSLTPGQSTQAGAVLRDASGNELSNREITWSSSNTSVATVSATGLVTAVAVGSASITATSEGVTGSAPITITPPPVATVTVTLNAPSLTPGQSTQSSATLLDAGGNVLTGRTITWSSSNPSVATINAVGLATAVAPGTTTISATSEGVTGTASLTVEAPPPPPPPADNTVFAEGFESGTLAAWQDGVDPTKHRVLNNASLAHSGAYVLEMTYQANQTAGWLTRFFMPGYDSLYVSYWMRLEPNWVGGTKLIDFRGSRTDNQWSASGKAGVCPNGSDFFSTSVTLGTWGDPLDMSFYTYYPAMSREADGVTCWGRYQGTGTTTYASNRRVTTGVWHKIEFWVKLNTVGQNNAVQRMWLDGQLKGEWTGFSFRSSDILRLNSFTIDGSGGSSQTQRLYVDDIRIMTVLPTIEPPPPPPPPARVASVSVTLNAPALDVGQSTQAAATTRDANGSVLTGRSITWSSSNTNVATVSATGLVSAVGAGTASIQATSEGITGSAALTVNSPPPPPAPVAAIVVTLNAPSLLAGQSTQATASLRDAGGNLLTGRTVTWQSSNSTVATVNASGLVSAVAAGSAMITATSEGVSGSAALTVTLPAVASVAVTLGSSSLTVGQTTQASALLRDALGGTLTGRLVTWSSSNTSVATVSATGLVTAVGGGSASIRATSEGVTGGASLTVSAPPPPPPGTEPVYTPGSNSQSFFDDFERYSDASSLKGGGWAITTGADPYLEFTSGSGNGGGKAIGFHWTSGNGWLGAEHTMSSQPGRVGYVSWDYRAPNFQYVGPSPDQQGIKFFIVNNGTSNRITIGLNTAVDIGMVQSNGVYLWVQPSLTPWGSQLATIQHLTDGGWHRLTLRRTKESSNGAMDGALELWVDGEKLFDLQRIGTGTMSIEEIMLAGTFNGGSPKDQREWYDNVRVWY